MEPNKVSNNTSDNMLDNMPDNMDVVVMIDKDKLPEDVRKMLEQNLPEDVRKMLEQNLPKDTSEQLKLSQDKVFGMLQNGKMGNIIPLQRDKRYEADKNISRGNDIPKDNMLFTIQTGEIIGNIYKDDAYKREEDSYIKKKDMKDLGIYC